MSHFRVAQGSLDSVARGLCQFLKVAFRRGLKGSEGETVLSLLLDCLLQMAMQIVLWNSFLSF